MHEKTRDKQTHHATRYALTLDRRQTSQPASRQPGNVYNVARQRDSKPRKSAQGKKIKEFLFSLSP
jgi:hypothetical protein